MDTYKKLELLKKYDFSQSTSPLRIGFKGTYRLIEHYASNLMSPDLTLEKKWEIRDRMLAIFAYVRIRYDSIDFKELESMIETDEDKQDFSTLFKTRDILPQLGAAIYEMILKPTADNFSRIQALLADMRAADKPPYRRRIRSLEEELKGRD